MMRVAKLLTFMLVLMALLSAAAVAGCGDDGNGQSSGTTAVGGTGSDSTSPTGSPTTEELPGPGVNEQDDGTVQAIGILAYQDLEGGFWAVVEATELGEVEDADIIAVLGPSEQIPGPVSSYENNYVSVTGTLMGASIYQAGPFIEVNGIRMLKKLAAE